MPLLLMLLVMMQLAIAYEPFGQDIRASIVGINDITYTSPLPQKAQTDVAIKQGANVQVAIKFKNFGKDGCQRVEVGIYNKKDIDVWYPLYFYSAITKMVSADNCKAGEPNVQTKELCLAAGEEKLAIYNIVAPTFQKDEAYTLVANTYECCYIATEQQAKNAEGYICSLNKGDANYYTQYFQRVDLTGVVLPWFPPNECADGKKETHETDVDCGGLTCANKCEVGKFCSQGNDCKTAFCDAGVCKNRPNCGDGIKNQGEQGVDCGGPCQACDISGATCSDGKQNGNEAGVDCGGSCLKACGAGGVSQDSLLIWIYVGMVIVGLVLFFYTSFMWSAIIFIVLGALLFLMKILLG